MTNIASQCKLLVFFIWCVISNVTSEENEELFDALFITPYLQNKNAHRARELSQVKSNETLNITSYTGYITVDEKFDSNLFFWFFPVEGGGVENAPLIVWLQGGPGASSLLSMFKGVGPFFYENEKLIENPYSWHKNHSLLFIDNPIGAGFSFSNSEQGFSKNQDQVTENLYLFLMQFFELFPELVPVPTFFTGQSYAGRHIPSLVYYIHEKNKVADTKINIKGISIGNAWIDPETLFEITPLLYQLGLLDESQYIKMHAREDLLRRAIRESEWLAAYEIYTSLLYAAKRNMEIYSLYNYVTEQDCYVTPKYTKFVTRNVTRNALHVGNHTYDWLNENTGRYLEVETMKSAKPQLEAILEHYKVLLYNGQLDVMIPYVNSVKMHNSLNWSGSEAYKKSKRVPWFIYGKLIGYKKKSGNLEEVMIRNVGHCVADETPELLSSLITAFTHDTHSDQEYNEILFSW